MSFAAALILAASAATAPAPGEAGGAQLASAQARATIVQAVVVRQGSGLERRGDSPVPQVRRQGRTVLVEFE